jgi:ectoine hydroxylase-related dioxygenase (phytanoyl-CoA dioxygenase family)
MISEDDILAYERDGVVCIRSVIDPATAATMRQAARSLMDRKQPASAAETGSMLVGDSGQTVENETGRFFSGLFMSDAVPIFKDFALTSALPQAAAALMRSKVARFFFDQIFIKEPGTISPTRWHHDMPFWPLTGSHLISAWVALTPVTKASSGMEYVAGSHLWDKFFRPTTPSPDESMEPAPDFNDPANRRNHRFLHWDMEPGDVLFHHPLAVHGAGANGSLIQDRVGLSIRYIGDDARWTPREKTLPLPRAPRVAPGEYPSDDEAFPVAWPAPG